MVVVVVAIVLVSLRRYLFSSSSSSSSVVSVFIYLSSVVCRIKIKEDVKEEFLFKIHAPYTQLENAGIEPATSCMLSRRSTN